MPNFIFFIFLFIFLIAVVPPIHHPTEFKQFCLIYMRYVNQYPGSLSAGCCDINHPSNDVLKEEYLGEPMLYCDGQYIYE